MSHHAPGDVFVWWMECVSPSPALTARWRACLDEAELAKADRFHFEVDRSTYLAAHWLLRTDALEGQATGLGDPGPWLVESATELGRVVQSRPAFRIDGGPAAFAWVGRPWGADPAEWAHT